MISQKLCCHLLFISCIPLQQQTNYSPASGQILMTESIKINLQSSRFQQTKMGSYLSTSAPLVQKKTKCCNNHPLTKWKVYSNDSYLPYSTTIPQCNICSQRMNNLLSCEVCGFGVCHKCNPVKHNDICQTASWKLITSSYCHYCAGLIKPSLLMCENCGIQICYTCEKFQHSKFCSEKAYFFQQNNSTCTFCEQAVLSYQECRTCKLKVCNKCRQNIKWE